MLHVLKSLKLVKGRLDQAVGRGRYRREDSMAPVRSQVAATLLGGRETEGAGNADW